MMYLSMALYLLGIMFVMIFMEAEEGYERDIKILAAFWPFFTLYAMFVDVFLGPPDDDKE